MSKRFHQIDDLGGPNSAIKLVGTDGSNNDVLVTPDQLILSSSIELDPPTSNFVISMDASDLISMGEPYQVPNDTKYLNILGTLGSGNSFAINLPPVRAGGEFQVNYYFLTLDGGHLNIAIGSSNPGSIIINSISYLSFSPTNIPVQGAEDAVVWKFASDGTNWYLVDVTIKE